MLTIIQQQLEYILDMAFILNHTYVLNLHIMYNLLISFYFGDIQCLIAIHLKKNAYNHYCNIAAIHLYNTFDMIHSSSGTVEINNHLV